MGGKKGRSGRADLISKAAEVGEVLVWTKKVSGWTLDPWGGVAVVEDKRGRRQRHNREGLSVPSLTLQSAARARPISSIPVPWLTLLIPSEWRNTPLMIFSSKQTQIICITCQLFLEKAANQISDTFGSSPLCGPDWCLAILLFISVTSATFSKVLICS